MPFGFDFPEFRTELEARLRQDGVGALKEDFTGTVWLVAGSATLVNILYNIFPRARFEIVQVGKKIWDDQINARTKIHVAPEAFYDTTLAAPPYPSAEKYDAKLWQFVTAGGASGDIIWNVAGH